MNTSLIANLSKHNVYYINGSHLSFYIAIPYKDFPKTNITIELYPNYDKLNPNNNDSIWIKDEVTRIYKDIDNNNISLVIPIFYDNKLKQTDDMMNQNLFLELDANISSVINSAYQILSKGNIQVDKKIYLINNSSFNNFSKWLLQRYSTRIEYKTYFELESSNNTGGVVSPVQQPFSNPVENSNVNVGSSSAVPSSEQAYTGNPATATPQTPVQNINPGMTFVTTPAPEQIVTPPTTTDFMNNTPNNESVEVPNAGSAGFVSYLLLGIITVIICLGILYIML